MTMSDDRRDVSSLLNVLLDRSTRVDPGTARHSAGVGLAMQDADELIGHLEPADDLLAALGHGGLHLIEQTLT